MARGPAPASGYTAADFRRRIRHREPYDRVLIVCEGITEKHYFDGLVLFLGLSSANIRIIPSRQTDPVDVVRFGIELAKDAQRSKEAYQRLYCVFDLDRPHANALALAAATKLRATSVHLATSNPCFEFWLRLHYGYTDRAYTAVGNNTACDEVCNDLRRQEPNYKKGEEGLFRLFDTRVNNAVTNGHQLDTSNRKTGSNNPSCTVHQLVEDLMTLKVSRPA